MTPRERTVETTTMGERVKVRSTTKADKELLTHFGLVTEESLARLLGVTVKTLKNRPRDDLPKFVKKGHRRLFVEASVKEYLGLEQ